MTQAFSLQSHFPADEPRALPWAGMSDTFSVVITGGISKRAVIGSQARFARCQGRSSGPRNEQTVPFNQRPAPIRDDSFSATRGHYCEREGMGRKFETDCSRSCLIIWCCPTTSHLTSKNVNPLQLALSNMTS